MWPGQSKYLGRHFEVAKKRVVDPWFDSIVVWQLAEKANPQRLRIFVMDKPRQNRYWWRIA
jgi:hypothetical protein